MKAVLEKKKRGRPRKVVAEVVVGEQSSTAITIVEDEKRSKLGEGREHQLGFGFLKKVGHNNFIGVMPISPL
jgi:hypothetical protein